MNDKLKPKKIIKIMYNCLILFAAILAIIRWISAFNNEIVVINAEINSHISNFALSLIFYLGVGFTWILQKMTFKLYLIIHAIVDAANAFGWNLLRYFPFNKFSQLEFSHNKYILQ